MLFTTNCLTPPKSSYSDQVFITALVSHPGMIHIDGREDLFPVIQRALEPGDFQEEVTLPGISDGAVVTTDSGREAALATMGAVARAIRTKELCHTFLVGGCSGARPGRNYYTDFVKQTPEGALILILTYGKYRLNDLELGSPVGIPRPLDMGQCNGAFGAIQVAIALARASDCSVNDFPLTLVPSWYGQKTAYILSSLLHLGIKNIYLGPTLPTFPSPAILGYLVEQFEIHSVSTSGKDLVIILT